MRRTLMRLMVVFGLAEANIDAREHREDERLNEGYQHLKAIKEDAEQHADNRHDTIAHTRH